MNEQERKKLIRKLKRAHADDFDKLREVYKACEQDGDWSDYNTRALALNTLFGARVVLWGLLAKEDFVSTLRDFAEHFAKRDLLDGIIDEYKREAKHD